MGVPLVGTCQYNPQTGPFFPRRTVPKPFSPPVPLLTLPQALIILVIGAIILVKCRTAGICCYDRPLMNVSEAEVSPFYTAPAPHYSHNDVEAVPLLPSEAATGYIVYNPAGQNPNFPPSQ